MSKTPEVDRTIAVNKSEAAANQKAGDKARARVQAGSRIAERDDNAARAYQGELNRYGTIVEKQQTNRIEKKPTLAEARASVDTSKVRAKGRGSGIGL